jgi:hypothetical protein
MRNRVERFFRYLKDRTVVFHHKMSANRIDTTSLKSPYYIRAEREKLNPIIYVTRSNAD